MIKQASFFKRRPDLDLATFHEYWRTRHADVVRKLTGFERYVQNHTIGGDGPFDGIAEVWFEDMDAMRTTVGSEELAAIRADEANFIDADSMGTIITTEHVIIDGAPAKDAQKLLGLVNRQLHNDPETFQSIYKNELGPLVKVVPGIDRYVQAHCRLGIYKTDRTPPYDAVASLWFSDRDGALASPEMARVGEFERTLFDFERVGLGWVNEVEIAL